MLTEASTLLAARCTTLTMIASSKSSLSKFDHTLDMVDCHRYLLNLNWSDPIEFVSAISRHILSVGVPNMVLAWVHEDNLAAELVKMFAIHNTCTDFFHVRGSSAGNPNADSQSNRAIEMSAGDINYHEIILGFQLAGSGERWLDHSEISKGIILAIDNPEQKSIVGSIQPWSSRP